MLKVWVEGVWLLLLHFCNSMCNVLCLFSTLFPLMMRGELWPIFFHEIFANLLIFGCVGGPPPSPLPPFAPTLRCTCLPQRGPQACTLQVGARGGGGEIKLCAQNYGLRHVSFLGTVLV